jgi:hypothetical protein
MGRMAGSFGSRVSDSVDGVLSMLGEVLKALDRFEAEAANDRQCGVS